MASKPSARRKPRRGSVPYFMGRASVLVRPRTEPRAVWKSRSFVELLVVGARPVVLTQQGLNWCWAAVSQAVLALEGNNQTQQQIVNRHTGRNCPITNTESRSPGDCTAEVGCALKCDDTHDFRLAMAGWQINLENYYLPENPNPLARLRRELALRPVAGQLQFGGGEAHCILITGCIGAGDNPDVQFLSPFYNELAPSAVGLKVESWSKLTTSFDLDRNGHYAGLSHIYPRL